MKKIPFCCDSFRRCVENAGYEGFTAIPKDFRDILRGFRFTLQCRIFKETHIYTMEHTIIFCPWCGCNLDDFIINHPDMILKLADENKHFLN